MVKDHSDSEKGNPLSPHRLLLSINSKGSFICTIPPDRIKDFINEEHKPKKQQAVRYFVFSSDFLNRSPQKSAPALAFHSPRHSHPVEVVRPHDLEDLRPHSRPREPTHPRRGSSSQPDGCVRAGPAAVVVPPLGPAVTHSRDRHGGESGQGQCVESHPGGARPGGG